jgi:hypothetical protein
MGIFRLFWSLFSRKKTPIEEARELMSLLEKYLEENGPLLTVQFMASEDFVPLKKKFWPKELIGVQGPLHDEFIALLARIKERGDREYITK